MKIHIPKDCEKIIVLLSGGIDSALLLFLLMRERKETGRMIPVKCFVMRSSTTAHTGVLNWISEYYQEEIPFELIPKFYIREAVSNILLIDSGYVYSGCNLVLENHFTPSVYLMGDTPPVRGPALNEFHLRPFIDIPKDVIIQEYQKLNIMDLLKITVSCGVSDNPCGGCYFCLEREWGMKKAGIDI